MRLIALGLAASSTVASAQQTLDRRVASAPDGAVRFTYAARAGVCGDGRSFIADDAPGSYGMRTWVFHGTVSTTDRSPDWRSTCLPGPAWVFVSKTGARITRLDVFVGPEFRVTAQGTDLGRVSAAEAALWLLDLAESGPSDDVTGRAFFAAALADSARLTERLIQVARNRERRAYVRERAVRWLGEVAEREGTAPAADAAMQAIAGDEGDVRTVRERAIRDLRQTPENDAFLRRAYGRLSDTSLKERVIRRLGESWSAENTRWIRRLAVNAGEALGLRERAIRVLGELDHHDQLIALYAELTDVTLKERVIRLVGEQGDPAGLRWLRTLAEDRTEHSTLRERAIRVLGEQGETGYLREVAAREGEPGLRDRAVRLFAESGGSTEELIGLYETARSRSLQERLVRLLAERGDDDAVDKLIAIARSDPDGDLRRLAVRRLSESGHPEARSFLRETVRR